MDVIPLSASQHLNALGFERKVINGCRPEILAFRPRIISFSLQYQDKDRQRIYLVLDSGSISPHRKNLYLSSYPDGEATPKEPDDEFLKGHPVALAPRSDTSSWHPDLAIHIPPIDGP
jgi:hypothetical protein